MCMGLGSEVDDGDANDVDVHTHLSGGVEEVVEDILRTAMEEDVLILAEISLDEGVAKDEGGQEV